jgi:hypothetical protein
MNGGDFAVVFFDDGRQLFFWPILKSLPCVSPPAIRSGNHYDQRSGGFRGILAKAGVGKLFFQLRSADNEKFPRLQVTGIGSQGRQLQAIVKHRLGNRLIGEAPDGAARANNFPELFDIDFRQRERACFRIHDVSFETCCVVIVPLSLREKSVYAITLKTERS